MRRPGVEPATLGSRVRHANHYATKTRKVRKYVQLTNAACRSRCCDRCCSGEETCSALERPALSLSCFLTCLALRGCGQRGTPPAICVNAFPVSPCWTPVCSTVLCGIQVPLWRRRDSTYCSTLRCQCLFSSDGRRCGRSARSITS